MKIERRQRAGTTFIRLSLPDIHPQNDILSCGRDCAIDLHFMDSGCGRPFDKIPHFRIIRGDSGMAFPELLREYGKLFSLAADFVDGKYPQPTHTSMYPRTNYEMTGTDLNKILDACKPVPLIMLQCGMPRSPQERANDAWAELGTRMGFDPMTVQPREGMGNRFFTAIPSETETQKQERLEKEAEESKRANIAKLESEIAELQSKLTDLFKT